MQRPRNVSKSILLVHRKGFKSTIVPEFFSDTVEKNLDILELFRKDLYIEY